MLSKSIVSVLALTSAVYGSPALRRQVDPCQDAYKACIAAGTPEIACSCTLTACLGEDSARNREYCASATANLPKTTAAPSTPASSTGYACNPAHSYPSGASCISTAGSLTLVTPSASTSSTGYACNPAHSYPGGVVCTQVGSTLALITPSPSATAASTAAAAPKVSGTNAAASGSSPKKIVGKTWSLNNVNRYCGDGNAGCDYNFDIVANGKTEHCTVIRMPGSNAATESFSNQPCSGFSVSWGYVKDPAPAFAVLTVVDKAGELAWFGISNINGQAVTASNPFGSGQYGNVGPEQVYTYN